MTLLQIAAAFLIVSFLGTLALALDWSSAFAAMDSAAIETARFFLPLWEPIERVFFR